VTSLDAKRLHAGTFLCSPRGFQFSTRWYVLHRLALMSQNPHAYAFASDNTAPATPEALNAFIEANAAAHVASYGDDALTARATKQIEDFFECRAEVFFVFSGTAANALALSALRKPYESVFCTADAHIEKDESAAPEFFSQGLKLHLVSDARGDKVCLQKAARHLANTIGMHSAQPKIVSITQTTEFGTCYSPAEIETIASFCRQHELRLHMDGARFANALAATGATPAALTWKAGVDVLSLGGTKNGVCTSEAVVFFHPADAHGFLNRRKQGGQLLSKMRYLAAPWLGALPHYVSRAAHANACAQRLAARVENIGLKLAFPVEANGVFTHFPAGLAPALEQRGWHFYKFAEPDVFRLMCAWNTSDAEIDAFLADVTLALQRASR
jgi:threonine aldolase